MNRHWLKKTGIELFVIFLLSLVPLLWFRPGMVMVGHDHVAPLVPMEFVRGRFSAWNDQFFGRSQVLILGTILIHAIDAIPSVLGFGIESTQKIVFVFWFFMMGISMYVLASVLKGNSRVFKFLAVLLYQFNFFILQGWWIGEKSKFSAYVAGPLLLSVYLLVDRGMLTAIVGGLLGAVILFLFNASGLYGIPLYGGAAVTIGLFILFSSLVHLRRRAYAQLRRILGLTVCLAVFGFFLNAYIYLPALFRLKSQLDTGIAQIGGLSGVISWASEISANTSFLNLMRLQGISEWYDNPQHPYAGEFLQNPLLIGLSFIWPILVFASLFTVRQNQKRHVLYFFLVYLVGLFFAAGTHPPLGFLYQSFVEKVPGFLIFRTPYFKFAPAIFLSNAMLISFFVDTLSVRIRKAAAVALVAIILTYHYPFFEGNFFSWKEGFSTRLAVPQYVYDFGSWLNQPVNRYTTRVLMLPPNSPDLQYSLYTWGYLSFQALPTLLSNASVVINNDQINQTERILLMSLYDSILRADRIRTKNLVELLKITHVIIQTDVQTAVRSSVALEPSDYLAGLLETGLFVPKQDFGKWKLYSYAKSLDVKPYLATGVYSVDASQEDLPHIFSLLDEPYDFVDHDSLGNSGMRSNNNIVVPNCINCFKQNRPIIAFPTRNILPGDILYSFVLFTERLRKAPADPKSAIYNTLGTTLKRVSEINEMLYTQKFLEQEVVDRFVGLLDDIERNFQKLESPSDKFRVALDIAHYMRAQRNYLRPNLGKYVVSGSQTTLTGEIFSSIHKLEKFVEPLVVDLEQPNVRVYQFNLDEGDEHEITLQSKRLIETMGSQADISLFVDNVQVKAQSVNRSAGTISFGTFAAQKGFHTVKLMLPKSDEQTVELIPTDTEFSQQNEAVCFGSKIRGISSGKLYKITGNYLNDFSDNLLFFLWEIGQEEGQKLINAIRLSAGPFVLKTEYVFDVTPGVKEALVAYCAPNLTQDRVNNQFDLKINETLFPTITLSSLKSDSSAQIKIASVKKSTTRYEMVLPDNVSYPAVLVLPNRYDTWWTLTNSDARHIMVNEFANGWVIRENPKQPLIIVYYGQIYFVAGLILTGCTACVIVLILYRRRRTR